MSADWEIFNIEYPQGACKIPGGTCLLAYRGSISHGMYVPSFDPNSIDDVDLMGVVLAPPIYYLGLHEWGSRGTKDYYEGQYDCVFYDIRKAISLLLQGNPNILSLLWLRPEHYLYRSPVGSLLVSNRNLFVGKHVYNAFAGYAYQQLEKMETRDPAELREYLAITAELKRRGAHPNHKGEFFETSDPSVPATGIERDVAAWSLEKLLAGLHRYQKKGGNIGYMGDKRKHLVLEHGYDAKNAAHLIRLLRMADEFLKTGTLQVFRPDATELLQIKRGEWTLERIKEHATELFAKIKVSRDASTLPAHPDYDGAERLLVEILTEHISGEPLRELPNGFLRSQEGV